MGFKGYRLRGMGQLDSQRAEPHLELVPRSVAVQVALVKAKYFKPVSHFMASWFETRRFQAMGLNWIQVVQLAPPQQRGVPRRVGRTQTVGRASRTQTAARPFAVER